MGQYKDFKEIQDLESWTIVSNSTVHMHIFTETSFS